jgi:WD40 repeat protein
MNRVLLFSCLILLVWAPAWAQDKRPQLALQIGHQDRVIALAVSPDGQTLASGGADLSAKIWDVQSGTLRFSLPHAASVLALSWASDATLVTADAAGTISVFDAVSGGIRSKNEGSQLEMSAAAISPDMKLAAFALPRGQIQIRNIHTGAVAEILDGHPTRVLSLGFSPDSQTLASSSDAFAEKTDNEAIARRAGDVRLWDVAGGELIRVLRGHALAVRGMAWSHDGARLASVGESGTVVLWNAKTFAQEDEINVSQGQGRALSVAFSPDDARIVAGWRGGIKSFDGKRPGEALWSQKGEAVPSVAFGRDGRIVAGENDGELHFLASQNGEVSSIRGHIGALAVVRASGDGKLLAGAGGDGALSLWDAARGSLIRSWRAHDGMVHDLAFSSDGLALVTAGADAFVRFWDVPSGQLRRTLAKFKGPVSALALAPNSAILAVGVTDGGGISTVTLWNGADGTLQTTLDEPRGTVYSLSFGPDGTLAAACGNWESRGEILVWNPERKLRARGFLRGARSLAISGDGRRLVGAGTVLDEKQDYISAGDLAQIWSLRAGEIAREVTATSPGAHALGVAIAADGKSFATASRDGAIRLWDGVSSAPIRVLRGHNGPVNSVFFVPRSQNLVSAGSDGTVRLWNPATGQLLATLLTLFDPKTPETGAVAKVLSPNWLAVSPKGYYDGSPGAGRFVQWRLGADVFPVEAFEGAFRRPEMLGAALRGQDLETLAMGSKFAQGQAIPPQVSIASPKAGSSATEPFRVQISASDNKNLKSIQLFVNGRPATSQMVKSDAKPIDVGAKPLSVGAKPLSIGAKPLEVGAKPLEVGAKPIPASHGLSWDFSLAAQLPPADGGTGVTLKALVTDGDGLQGSDEIRLKRPARNGGFGTLHILSIGVSSYANPAFNLKFAAKDANAFAGLWNGPGGQIFAKVNATSLTDARATSGAVQNAMREIAQSALPDDVVAIFLSGHGIARAENEFFFASHDVNLGKLDDTAVPWKAFQTALSGSKARRVIIFLDACHSGGALGGKQAGNEEMAAQLVKNAGAIVFSSSLGRQYSFELDELKHGAFTHALIEGLQGGKADLDAGTGRDGLVNVEELLTFLRARVPQLTDGAQMPACPLLRDFGEPFPLIKSVAKP